MSDVNASFPQSIQVGDYTVYKLKLSEYAQIFDKLQKLPTLFSEFTDVTNDAVLAALPRIVATALPEVLEILAIATRTPVEELDENMTPTMAVKCIKALFQINDFFGLWEEIKITMPTMQTAKEGQQKKK